MKDWTVISNEGAELSVKEHNQQKNELMIRKLGKLIPLSIKEIEALYQATRNIQPNI